MITTIIIGLIVLGTIVLAIWAVALIGKQSALNKKDTLLTMREETLETAKKSLEADQKAFEKAFEARYSFAIKSAERVERMLSEMETVDCSYTVTESDELKYSGETAIRNVARNRLAHNIAFDIIKKFPEPKVEIVDGRKKYSYRFKVIEEKCNS